MILKESPATLLDYQKKTVINQIFDKLAISIASFLILIETKLL